MASEPSTRTRGAGRGPLGFSHVYSLPEIDGQRAACAREAGGGRLVAFGVPEGE